MANQEADQETEVALKMQRIYDNSLAKLMCMSKLTGKDLIQNGKIVPEEEDELHEISFGDYAAWVLRAMMEFDQSEEIHHVGVTTLQKFIKLHIFPDTLCEEILHWSTGYEGDGWPTVRAYCAFAYSDEHEMEETCGSLIRKMGKDVGSTDLPEKELWKILDILVNNVKTREATIHELTEADGIQLLSDAVSRLTKEPAHEISRFEFLTIRGIFEFGYADRLARLLNSPEFGNQVKWFLPTFFENVKKLEHWKLYHRLEDFLETVFVMSSSDMFPRKFLEWDFFSIIKKFMDKVSIPFHLEEENSCKLLLLAFVFAMLAKIHDPKCTQKVTEVFHEEIMEHFPYTKDEYFHIWICRIITPSLEDFVKQNIELQEEFPHIKDAVALSQKILLEKNMINLVC